MKRAVACIFALVFWMLLLCTALSFRIKEWMTPKVTTTVISSDVNTFESVLPISCLYRDETGDHLYQPADASVASSVVSLREVFTQNYQVFPDRIVMKWPDMERYIQFSSRQLKPEDIVRVLQWPDGKEDDVWLAVFPEEVPVVESASNRLTVDTQEGNAFLLSVGLAERPYSESRAKTMISVTSPDAAEDDPFGAALYTQNLEYHVYSLLDFRQFFAQAPWLSLVLALMLVSLGLWAASCVQARRGKKGRKWILCNAGVSLLLFVGILLCLRRIDLPSSLLPVQTILDASHYSAEFSLIFRGLEALSAHEPAAVALSQAQAAIRVSIGIVAAGAILGAVIALLESFKCEARKKSVARHTAG